MKKVNFARLSLLLCTLLAVCLVCASCGKKKETKPEAAQPAAAVLTVPETSAEETVIQQSAETSAASEAPEETEETTAAPAPEIKETSAAVETEPETSVSVPSVEKDGSYTTPEDVAEYIHTFGTLPPNFITKNEAKALGWDSKKGNLREVAEGKSIGGDRFGNREGQLPEKEGRFYTECDVNYDGGTRGAERIVFSNDGLIFYTDDHYSSFTQLY